jgi:hypothetical protein
MSAPESAIFDPETRLSEALPANNDAPLRRLNP